MFTGIHVITLFRQVSRLVGFYEAGVAMIKLKWAHWVPTLLHKLIGIKKFSKRNFYLLFQSEDMSKKTVLNEQYRGLVEAMSIPAEIHERDGKKYASIGSAVPIHSCTKEQVGRVRL